MFLPNSYPTIHSNLRIRRDRWQTLHNSSMSEKKQADKRVNNAQAFLRQLNNKKKNSAFRSSFLLHKLFLKRNQGTLNTHCCCPSQRDELQLMLSSSQKQAGGKWEEPKSNPSSIPCYKQNNSAIRILESIYSIC